MKRVVIESPYAADTMIGRWQHRRYARACIRDSLMRGESPLASHLLYTQRGVLLDGVPAERKMGIEAGHVWIGVADAVVVCTDLGISRGMSAGIAAAKVWGVPIEYRQIGWCSRLGASP